MPAVLVKAGPKFPETRWSLVSRAGKPDNPEALTELLHAYWFPVYCHLRRRWGAGQEAIDVTQGLFAQLIARNDLAGLERRSFRGWLKTCAYTYLVKYHGKVRREGKVASAVGGARAIDLRVDLEAVERRVQALLAQGLSPDQLFDRCWAQTVVLRAAARLRERSAQLDDAEIALEVIQRLSAEEILLDDAQLAELLGRTPGAIRTARSRTKTKLRALFAECLQDEIFTTVDRAADIDDELKELLHAIAS